VHQGQKVLALKGKLAKRAHDRLPHDLLVQVIPRVLLLPVFSLKSCRHLVDRASQISKLSRLPLKTGAHGKIAAREQFRRLEYRAHLAHDEHFTPEPRGAQGKRSGAETNPGRVVSEKVHHHPRRHEGHENSPDEAGTQAGEPSHGLASKDTPHSRKPPCQAEADSRNPNPPTRRDQERSILRRAASSIWRSRSVRL